MRDFTGLIKELRELSQQAGEAADNLGRLQELQGVELKWSMDVKEVALALGVNQSTVYEYCRRGVLPCTQLGTRYIIPRMALMQWMNGKNERRKSHA